MNINVTGLIVVVLVILFISVMIYTLGQTIHEKKVFKEVSQEIIKHNQKGEHYEAINLAKKIRINFWPDYNMLKDNIRLTHESKLALADSLEKNGQYDLSLEQYRMILGFSNDEFSTLRLLMNDKSYFSFKQLVINKVN